jgi:hypothetical protein
MLEWAKVSLIIEVYSLQISQSGFSLTRTLLEGRDWRVESWNQSSLSNLQFATFAKRRA